jgi:hypothetical protein
MNFSSTITKSLRRWLRIHPPGELSPFSIEKRLAADIKDIKKHGLKQPVQRGCR